METTVEEVKKCREGKFILIDDAPCKVTSLKTSKPGKHGEAKARLEAVGIFDHQKRVIVKPAGHKVRIPIVVKKTAQDKSPEVVSGATMPEVVPGGTHSVQIGSFGSVGDAIALKKKMLGKYYPAFVVEADLGKKGLWYRVRIGPYKNSAAAKRAQKVLEEKEKIKGFISRQ